MGKRLKLESIASVRDDESKSCFIIMPINRNYALQSYFEEAIGPAIRDAGFDPVRIDQKIVVGKITDEIIKEIERARVVIVDTTEDRPNCYFEAGFAVARGKRVIWLRSKSLAKDDIPFDVKDYQFVLYETVRHLRDKLTTLLESV